MNISYISLPECMNFVADQMASLSELFNPLVNRARLLSNPLFRSEVMANDKLKEWGKEVLRKTRAITTLLSTPTADSPEVGPTSSSRSPHFGASAFTDSEEELTIERPASRGKSSIPAVTLSGLESSVLLSRENMPASATTTNNSNNNSNGISAPSTSSKSSFNANNFFSQLFKVKKKEKDLERCSLLDDSQSRESGEEQWKKKERDGQSFDVCDRSKSGRSREWSKERGRGTTRRFVDSDDENDDENDDDGDDSNVENRFQSHSFGYDEEWYHHHQQFDDDDNDNGDNDNGDYGDNDNDNDDEEEEEEEKEKRRRRYVLRRQHSDCSPRGYAFEYHGEWKRGCDDVDTDSTTENDIGDNSDGDDHGASEDDYINRTSRSRGKSKQQQAGEDVNVEVSTQPRIHHGHWRYRSYSDDLNSNTGTTSIKSPSLGRYSLTTIGYDDGYDDEYDDEHIVERDILGDEEYADRSDDFEYLVSRNDDEPDSFEMRLFGGRETTHAQYENEAEEEMEESNSFGSEQESRVWLNVNSNSLNHSVCE